MAAPKKIDYDRIEEGWRAGVLSPHQLADAYTEQTGTPVSHAAIIKHFRKLGIPRDLSQKIKAKAESMVTQSMVTGKVTNEREIIDANAAVVAHVDRAHRGMAKRMRETVDKLNAELDTCGEDLHKKSQIAKNLTDTFQKLANLEREIFRLSDSPVETLKKALVQATRLDEAI